MTDILRTPEEVDFVVDFCKGEPKNPGDLPKNSNFEETADWVKKKILYEIWEDFKAMQ